MPSLPVRGGAERNPQKFPCRQGCPPPRSHRPREAVEAPAPEHLHLFPKAAWQSPSVAEEERIPLTLSFLKSADVLTANPVAVGIITLAKRPIGRGSIRGKVSRTAAK